MVQGRESMKNKGLAAGIICVFVAMMILPSVAQKNMEPVLYFIPFDDVIPPVTVLYFSPEAPDGDNGWYVSNVSVTLNATDDMSGVNVTYYRINSGAWEIYENPFFLNTSNYYTIDFYSIDNAGNVENVKSASCKIDVVPPVTTYHIDPPGYHILSLWATDDMSGVNHTFIQVDGGAWQEYSGPIFLTTDGSHIIKFYSIDRAGNVEDIQQITIHPESDKIPPVVHLTVEKIFFNKWKFIAEACDADSGMDKVEFYVDCKLLGNISNPGPLYEWNWTCPDSNGHTVQAIAYDLAGNSAESEVVNSFPQSQSQHQLQFNQLFLKSLGRFFLYASLLKHY
jgi:hypothetical protein